MLRFDKAFREELSRDWRVLLIAFSCLLFGFSAPAFALPFLFSEVINEFGWSREEATLLASAKYFTGAIAALLVGRFVDFTGSRLALIATLSMGGFALLSFLWVPSLEMYYLVGVLMGLAGPGAMVAVKVLVSRVFNASQGTATGIALLGTSVGSVIVPIVISLLISEYGWRLAFAYLSIGIWAITMPMLLFFFPGEAGAPRKAAPPAPGVKAEKTGLIEALRLAKHHPFWLLAGALFFAALVDQAFIQHQVLIFSDLGMSREMAALAISAMGIVGIACRVVAGNMLDSKSNKGLAFLYATLTLASLLAFYLVNPVILVAYVALRAIGHAAVLVDTTVMSKHVFGLANFGTVVGVYTAIVSLGYATGPWLMSRLYDMTGGYSAAFLLFALLPLVAAVLVWMLKPTYWLALRGAAAQAPIQSANPAPQQ